jgi:hypothetical protein
MSSNTEATITTKLLTSIHIGLKLVYFASLAQHLPARRYAFLCRKAVLKFFPGLIVHSLNADYEIVQLLLPSPVLLLEHLTISSTLILNLLQ